jgi:hypothetical protein
MTAPYTFRGSPVNVVRVFRASGHKLHLHRPVERGGQRRRQGWMLTCEGVPMAAFQDCEQATVVAGIEALLAPFAGVDRAAFAQAVDDRRCNERDGIDTQIRVLDGP